MLEAITDFIRFIGCLAVSGGVLFGGVIGIVNIGETYACSQYSDITGRKTEYRFPSGCFVQHADGSWLSLEEYKAVIVAREGLTK